MQLIHCPLCGYIADELATGNAKCIDCKGVREICSEMLKPDWHLLVNMVLAYTEGGSQAFVDQVGNVFIAVETGDEALVANQSWCYTSAGQKTQQFQISDDNIPF